MKKLLSILLIVNLFTSINAVWKNSGTMDFSESKMNVPEFENTGAIIIRGEKESFLNFQKFTGNGLILVKSGKLILKAKDFLFNGTIECDSECEIYTSTPENEIKITKKGKGKISFKQISKI